VHLASGGVVSVGRVPCPMSLTEEILSVHLASATVATRQSPETKRHPLVAGPGVADEDLTDRWSEAHGITTVAWHLAAPGACFPFPFLLASTPYLFCCLGRYTWLDLPSTTLRSGTAVVRPKTRVSPPQRRENKCKYRDIFVNFRPSPSCR
jgi:hypothetical protein